MRRLHLPEAVRRHPRVRRAGRISALAVVALAGWLLGLLLAARVGAPIGPFDTTVAVRPGAAGGTTVALPPLGTLRLDTHSGPLRLGIRVDELRIDDAEQILRGPAGAAEDQISDDVRRAVAAVAIRALLTGTLAAALAAAAVYRRARPIWIAAAVSAAMTTGGGAIAAATFRPEAIAEPEYTGLLAGAPQAIGDARQVIDRFDRYREQLRGVVDNVSELYRTLESLPAYGPDGEVVRVLHVSDLHLNPAAYDLLNEVVPRFGIDVVVDTGDLTDWGSEPEGAYVQRISTLEVPYVYVRGNHDSRVTQRAVARQPNAIVLDGEVREVAGLQLMGFGDPRFTPDKTTYGSKEAELAGIEEFAPEVASAVAAAVPRPDVVIVHDPRAAEAVLGEVPLVLAGHRHHVRRTETDGTLVLVEGSTGGAGLRGLEGEKPTALTASVLYFDRGTRRLQAIDRITVGGLGSTTVRISREVVERKPAPSPSPSG